MKTPNHVKLFDFDGTLAYYEKWKGKYVLGIPIQNIIDKVKYYLSEGYTCKIFTARDFTDLQVKDLIEQWCQNHIGQILEITNIKDFKVHQIFDDRANKVIKNTGITETELLEKLMSCFSIMDNGNLEWKYIEGYGLNYCLGKELTEILKNNYKKI